MNPNLMRELQLAIEDYGVGIFIAPTCVVQWAASKVADELGEEAALRQVSELNFQRDKAGYPLAYAIEVSDLIN